MISALPIAIGRIRYWIQCQVSQTDDNTHFIDARLNAWAIFSYARFYVGFCVLKLGFALIWHNEVQFHVGLELWSSILHGFDTMERDITLVWRLGVSIHWFDTMVFDSAVVWCHADRFCTHLTPWGLIQRWFDAVEYSTISQCLIGYNVTWLDECLTQPGTQFCVDLISWSLISETAIESVLRWFGTWSILLWWFGAM